MTLPVGLKKRKNKKYKKLKNKKNKKNKKNILKKYGKIVWENVL